jgi:hypothetical protein
MQTIVGYVPDLDILETGGHINRHFPALVLRPDTTEPVRALSGVLVVMPQAFVGLAKTWLDRAVALGQARCGRSPNACRDHCLQLAGADTAVAGRAFLNRMMILGRMISPSDPSHSLLGYLRYHQ